MNIESILRGHGLGASSDTLTTVRLTNLVTVSTDGTSTISIGIGDYNSSTDVLEVFHENFLLYPTENYTVNAAGTQITLSGFTANAGEKFLFCAWKRVKTSYSTMSATVLTDNSITNAKLVADAKVGSLALLQTTSKTDAVSAINEVRTTAQTNKQSITDLQMLMMLGGI